MAAVLPMRSTIMSDVAGGKKEIQVAKLPVGSRTTCGHTKSGNTTNNQIGSKHRLGLFELVHCRSHRHENRAEKHHCQHLIDDEPRHDPHRHQV